MSELHIRNSDNCPACCCGGGDIHEKCGGFWHERFVDDTVEDGFIHNFKCDKCNKEDFRLGYEDLEIEFKD